MDPFTMFALASAAPSLINMFSPQPSMPNQSPANALYGQISPYMNQNLQSAFSPNSNLLEHSMDTADKNLTNSFAGRGMGQSSFLDSALVGQNSDIARNWQADEQKRQSMALGNAMGLFNGAGQVNNDAWNRYLQSIGNRNSMMSGITGLGTNLASAYGASYQNNQNQQNFDKLNQTLSNNYGGGTGYIPPSGYGPAGYNLGVPGMPPMGGNGGF